MGIGMGFDFIRDGFLRVGIARKALFLATGGLSGFVLKDTPKRRKPAKASARPTGAKTAKAKRAKARKPARPKATKPIHKVTRPQQAKATRAKATRKAATKPRSARRPAKTPAPARIAAQAQPPAGAGPIVIERVAEPVRAATAAPFAPSTATPVTGQPLGQPGPGIGNAPRPVEPLRDPTTYDAVESSAQAARRLAESGGERDRSSSAFTSNGGNDGRG
jgi:ribonuclease E